MYPPSELLEQVEKQVLSEFKEQITYFEWWNEDEYTTIMVEIREIALEIPVSDRIREIVNTIIGHPDTSEYIVAISVSPIYRVGASDGLFNLIYDGGISVFFIDYYAPELPRTNPFVLSFFYTRMFKAIGFIQVDSPAQFWERFLRPDDEVDAKKEGVLSFRKDLLALPLRDFLLKHLDLIKHIAQATRNPLQILEPTPTPSQMSHSPNGTQASARTKKAHQMALALAVAAD
ncbi:MAG: hypothetical protein ACPGWR_22925 [Ardenticatenaceae bacterium]